MATSKKDKSKPPVTTQFFPIVGVGASAGGLDAFKRLLNAIPEDSGMAYVLVQHLDPSHVSMLPEILSRETKLPVHEITDVIHLLPNHIYIIPSNKILTSTDGVLKLTTRDEKILNLSIDKFFTSLADVHKEFAVGVLLSGTGSDGTLGLKSIKEHGGISIAQDQKSAAYDSMPQSAINAGVVDFILAPENIPAQLAHIISSYTTNHAFRAEVELPKTEEDIFNQILAILRQRSGVDFTYYKQPTFYRRIARRIAIVKKKNLADYLKFLRSDKAEQDALFMDVLIPVTSFFRDPKTFQALSDAVFPALFKNKLDDEPIRVWIAGCSTGEEAFSIAIALHEFLREKSSYAKIQIFASDISETAIKKARTGIYNKADVQMLTDTQLKKYFIKNGGSYEVNKLIRDMCVFAPHNFLKDPPFAKMDLISCRNVLIYMDTFLQRKALTVFHYALKENGFLLLGKSESTSPASELFAICNTHEKIYTRKPVPGRFIHIINERKEEASPKKDKMLTKQEPVYTDFRKSAEAILLSKYTPASVVVNEQMDIVHIHGIITPFLEAPQGKPTFNLLKMAREGLAFELRNALHKAKTSESSVVKENIPINITTHLNDKGGKGEHYLVNIEIIPLLNTVEPHYLILFTKTAVSNTEPNSGINANNRKSIEAQQFNQQLAKELAQTREDMRSITEDMEAANEELQSANEELQSSNEEMQSLNEELETSKEELQSTNEELIIVNQELIDKQKQLNAACIYSESIVSTIREPLIVLDKNLCIQTANDSFYNKFNAVKDETDGKLFYEIQNQLWNDPDVRSLLEKILPNKERLTDYEINLKIPFNGVRVLLLNALKIATEKNDEHLILLSIEDITERKLIKAELIKEKNNAEEATRVAEEALKAKQQFLSNMSHEIRTPMNAIVGFTNVLLKTNFSAEQNEYLQAIKMSGETLVALINDILDLAKVDSGKMTFEHVPFKLYSTITSIFLLFEMKIKEKGIKYINEYDSRIPEVLLGDSLRLRQILLNLLSNALKYTDKGTISVNIHLLKENAETVTLNFAVSDTGIGIAKENLGSIFESFQQATAHTTRLFGGTGLGLTIVKHLVEQQGGLIQVKSKLHEGSTFSFIMTFKKTSENIKSECELQESVTEIKNIKVLVAEDMALNQLLIRTILNDFGFECDIAGNGKIAIEKLQSKNYDIILMDLQMPVMDGYEATDFIRKKLKSTIPIIALTADVINMNFAKCNAIGMNDYIAKPIDEKLLHKKIVDLLRLDGVRKP
ncbi:MAG: response regulator [Paludibacter sp.]|nr:response regulator [Paludibacter sp.]